MKKPSKRIFQIAIIALGMTIICFSIVRKNNNSTKSGSEKINILASSKPTV